MKKRFNVKDKRIALRKLENNIEKINVKYINDIEAINVSILNTSNLKKLNNYIPELVMATWNENIKEFNRSLSKNDRKKFVFRALQGKFIPTALDSINITFRLENITWHDVSHLIRHQNFKFAADCSGDKIIENRKVALPEFIEEMNLFEEYDDAIKKLIHIYNVAINNNVHLQDARLMLPRTMTTFYYVTGSLNACINFIKQRIDRQVQPKSDNIIAIKLLLELCKILPQLSIIIDPNMKNSFYVNETSTNFASKWELPLQQNSKYLQNITEENFVYKNTHRDELPGNKKFVILWNKLLNELNSIKLNYYNKNKKLVDSCITGDWK